MRTPPRQESESFGLLLVQLGFHAAARFAEALTPVGLEARQAGMLRRLATNEGQSQHALGKMFGIAPNRMVFLVDELEESGFVERRKNPTDRRCHALYVTPDGRAALEQAAIARTGHESALAAGLTRAERRQLTGLLRKVATEQGINQDGLPGPPPRDRPPRAGPSIHVAALPASRGRRRNPDDRGRSAEAAHESAV